MHVFMSSFCCRVCPRSFDRGYSWPWTADGEHNPLAAQGLENAQLPEAAAKAFEELVANNLSYVPFLKIIQVSELLGAIRAQE